MVHDPTGRISLQRNSRQVRIRAGGVLIADSREAIELHETGYPVRQYIPRKDIAMELLQRSETITHCPFKGDATYYSIDLNGETMTDAAWSYEQPFEAMAEIKEHVAFDTRIVEEKFGPVTTNAD